MLGVNQRFDLGRDGEGLKHLGDGLRVALAPDAR
jgi:hypothetical protein